MNPVCHNQGVPQLPQRLTGAAKILGTITLRDRIDRSVDPTGAPMQIQLGTLTADFGDYSAISSTASAEMDLTEGCVGIISRPVRTGMVKPLGLQNLSVKGTAKGEILATSTSTGVYSISQHDPLMANVASVEIVGVTAGMGSFPSFDQMIKVVTPMEATEPKSDGTPELKNQAFTVGWVAGDSDWAEVDVTPVLKDMTMSNGGQVACFVPDTGCFTVPAMAATFLLAAQADVYTVSIQRHRYVATMLGAGSGVEAEAISEWRLSLKNGVLAP
jgi:hypothetical protein